MPSYKGPKDGYNFKAKASYRRSIWRRFRKCFGHACVDAQGLLMPGPTDLEIRTALDNGFREKNLHIVDINPAIVASHKRRFPKINTYGVDIRKACDRIRRKGVYLDVVNFDLTSNVTWHLMGILLELGWARCYSINAAIAVTALRGRERRLYLDEMSTMAEQLGVRHDMDKEQRRCVNNRNLNHMDLQRIESIQFAFMKAWWISLKHVDDINPKYAHALTGIRWDTKRNGIYVSSNKQTMLWTMFGVIADKTADLLNGYAKHSDAQNEVRLMMLARKIAAEAYISDDILKRRRHLISTGQASECIFDVR